MDIRNADSWSCPPNLLEQKLWGWNLVMQVLTSPPGYAWLSQVALAVKNLPANAGDIRDAGLIPRSERSPGGGHGKSLQYSCLENPMDRGAWWATVHGIAKGWT